MRFQILAGADTIRPSQAVVGEMLEGEDGSKLEQQKEAGIVTVAYQRHI
jgi:hypothetical protein